ncbi:MAG: lipopolysaccharide kinase InaA family protein [Gemmatimonadota bacterium]
MSSDAPSLPSPYRIVRAGEVRGFAVEAFADAVEAILASGKTLSAWAAESGHRPEERGRGGVYRVAPPVGRRSPAPGTFDPTHTTGARTSDNAAARTASRWVVRRYLRGGMVSLFLADRYLALGTPRPWAEAAASALARERGIATPPVVAGAVYPAGLFYRADLVTLEVAGAVELARLLFPSPPPEPEGAAVLEAVGCTVTRLAQAGVLHADLNATNVLVVLPGGGAGSEGPETPSASASAPRVQVVDLDRCRILPADSRGIGDGDGLGGRREAGRRRMHRRLRRSLHKLENRHHARLPEWAWAALARGVEGGARW